MTDQKAMEPFETRFADLVQTYTDPASARPVDALAVSRSAMAASRTAGWSVRRMGAGSLGRRIDGGRWAAAALAVVLVSVVGFAIVSRSSDSGIGQQPTPSASAAPTPRASAVGPVPEVLQHLWQRPLPVAPGDAWATAYLGVAGGVIAVGPVSSLAGASESTAASSGPDTVVVTAKAGTSGCGPGDVGVYRFVLEGKDTFVTLTSVGADACAAREAALTGPWVRADMPPPDEGLTLSPGTYDTTGFDPFADDAVPGRQSYTVPAGWKVKEDSATAFVLHYLADASAGQPVRDTFIFELARPRLAAAFKDGAICGPFGDEPGVGQGVDDIVAALVARPGVVSTSPEAVSVSGYEGTLLDLSVAPSWTGGCVAPEGPMVGIPLLRGSGGELGPTIGLVPDAPIRLILVDVGGGRTMAIAVACSATPGTSQFDAQLKAAMPVIESIELHPPAP